MIGVLVNFGTVILGGLVGVLLKKGIPERIKNAVMVALGLCVIYIGIDSIMQGSKVIVMLLAMAMGTFLGSLIKIEANLERFSNYVEKKLNKEGHSVNLSQGFVSATLIFCVGAMAIVGSIKAGLQKDNSTLFAKSVMDLISSLILASTLGFGVVLASFSVLIYQGLIVLLCNALSAVPTALIAEITSVGGVMIVAIGINLTNITKIKVADMLPAIIFTVPLYYLFNLIGI